MSDPTVHDWLSGTKRPKTHHREAIAVWTHDEVPIDSWLKSDEREIVRGVTPFDESSGTLPTVVDDEDDHAPRRKTNSS